MQRESIVRVGAWPRRDCASHAAFVREAVYASRDARLHAAVASSRGRRHTVNEDGHSTLDGNAMLFVVADGVGSGAMASHASRDLVAQLHAALSHDAVDAESVSRAVLGADREIARSIARRTDAAGAATFALCAAMDSRLSRWLISWVGDCRAYRVRIADGGPAELLTQDDTYRHLDETTPPGGSPDDPARMIGNGAVETPNLREIGLRDDELLMLCSDGIHRHADFEDIGRLLRGSAPLARRCVKLVEFVSSRGNRDDATVLAVQRSPRPRAPLARSVLMVSSLLFTAASIATLAADTHAESPLAASGQPYPSQVKR